MKPQEVGNALYGMQKMRDFEEARDLLAALTPKVQECQQEFAATLQDSGPNFTPIFQPNDQTLEGSFFSASKPVFAPKYAFFSIFREQLLQDLQSFARLQFQNLRKIS